MHYTFIYNPLAGKNRRQGRRGMLEALLRQHGFRFDLVETEAPKHAIELAQEASRTSDVVVAVGGDGTVQEVASGIVASGESTSLGVIPAGTGNDFVRMIGVPRRLEAAVTLLRDGRPLKIDYGIARAWEGDDIRERVFVNAIGIGFDANVAATVDGFKVLPGYAGYLAAALKTLYTWDKPHVRIDTWDHAGARQTSYEGSFLLATAGNGISSGGGFLLTPAATVTDGLIDLCIAEGVSTGRALQLIPMALAGKHVRAREIHMHRCAGLEIEVPAGVPVHADGEIIARQATRIHITIIPAGLSVLTSS